MSLWRLIAYKIKIYVARFTRGRKKTRYLRIASTLIIMGAFAGFAFGAYAIFAALRAYGDEGLTIATVIVGLVFHALLLMAFVFDIAATTNIFFLSSDLNLLMASPLSPTKIFAVKYLESLASGSVITLLIGVPVAAAYGLAFRAPAVYYPALFGIIVVFLSVPISLGTMFGLFISRVVPAARVKEILGLVGGVLALGLWMGFQMLRPRVIQSGNVEDLGSSIQELAAMGTHPALALLPSNLAIRTTSALAVRDFSGAAAPVVTLAVMAGTLVAVSMVMARRMYVTGWTRVVPGGRVSRARRRPLVRHLFAWLPAVERSVVATTANLFIRDPQQIMPVATITIMMALFPFIVGRSETGLVITSALIVRSFAVLSFVGAMHLATSATGIDGRSFWMLMAAPCSAARKLRAKLLVAAAFFIPLTSVIALAFRLAGAIGWLDVAKLIWLAACMTFAGGSIGVLLGITYTDWEWDLPKRMLKTSGRLVMLGIMAAFFVTASIMIKASSGARGVALPASSRWTVYVAGGIGAAFITGVMLAAAARKLRAMEWTS